MWVIILLSPLEKNLVRQYLSHSFLVEYGGQFICMQPQHARLENIGIVFGIVLPCSHTEQQPVLVLFLQPPIPVPSFRCDFHQKRIKVVSVSIIEQCFNKPFEG